MAGETAAVSMTVNGKPITANVDPRTLLVQLLREQLRLTGTHVGCDTSQCGACVVHVNGKAIKSCTVLALQLQGAEVLTIEGLAPADGPLHPMQEAFRENHGLQCGFCTPGMIMTAVDLVRRKGHDLDDRTIREELEGNICRCTGYQSFAPVPIPGGFTVNDALFHVFGPNPSDPDLEPSTITNMNGFVGLASLDGMVTQTDTTTGTTQRFPFVNTDMRFMQGNFRGADGRIHQGTFALV
jgi:carbon-monoxide dehydrogenase small subunit